MYRGEHSSNRRVPLIGGKWLAILAVPVGVLAVEAYLNLAIRANDYALANMRDELQQLGEELTALNADENGLQNFDRLASYADDMGLVAPTAEQVTLVDPAPGGGPRVAPPPQPFVLAGAEEPEAATPGRRALPGWMAAAAKTPEAETEDLDTSLSTLLGQF